MKKFFFLLVSILISGFVFSQTLVYHENFELPSLGDSVVTSGVPLWNITTSLHNNGLRSDSSRVALNDTSFLTTASFSTVGNTYVILEFAQICKVEFFDNCIIQVSTDNGVSWTQLTGTNYLGIGQFGTIGNKFCSASYADWLPGTPTAVPTDAWWKTEQFDISSIASNAPNVKVRWKMSDGNGTGAGGNYGWLIDDINVLAYPSEIVPPTITLINPIFQGTIYNLGPFDIRAKINDNSGINAAKVYYKINNGLLNSVNMIIQNVDTFIGTIPVVLDGDSVHYYVWAEDASPNHNTAVNPLSGTMNFLATNGISFPYVDNFDIINNLWTPTNSSPGSDWQLGTPAYGVTNSAHSSPNAWDVNLTTTYADDANCALTSPVFDFSTTANATLSFWHNQNLESCCDGVQMQYTTDGITWQVLGILNDPLGVNWYSYNIFNPGAVWSGNSSGWIKSEYDLSFLNYNPGPIQFRYVFLSDGSVTYDGFSIDDFMISPPPQFEAGTANFVLPQSGCGLGVSPVSIDIINLGADTINGNITAAYQVLGGTPLSPENVPNIIPPGDTATYTFSTPIDFTVLNQDSTFNIKAWVNLTGDIIHTNDTLSGTVISKFLPPSPSQMNASTPYATFTTLTSTGLDTIYWFDVPTGGSPIDTGYLYTTPVLYDTTIYYAQAGVATTAGLYINSLLTTGSFTTDHDAISGDDRGGIAITQNYFYYNGDNNAVRFDMPGLTNGVAFNKRDGIFSDLSGTGTLYTLWDGTSDPVGTSIASYNVNAVRTLNNDLSLGSTTITLSQTINLGGGNSSAVFSGAGFCILYSGGGTPANTFYRIDLPTGLVTVLGTYTLNASYAENWARWGIAEINNLDYSVVYVTNSTTISRLNLTTGAVSVVGTFSNLSDMACITYSPWTSRWYFHHESSSQFGGTNETAGYANGTHTLVGGGCPSPRVADTVFVTGIPALDASAQIIYQPTSGVNLTSTETVQMRIKNFGTSPISNFQVGYKIDALPSVFENVAATINPGDTLVYTFSQTANLYNYAIYTIKAWTDLSGDFTALNDTAYKTVECIEPVYCISGALYTYYENIGNVTISNTNNGNPIPVLSNPFAVNTYTDFTGLIPTMLAPGSSYPISVSAITQDTYVYDCWVNAWIDYNRDGIFDPVTEKVFGGPISSILTTTTGNVNVPITASLGLTRMRVVLVQGGDSLTVVPCGTYNYGETEDYTVSIQPLIPNDAGVTLITSPSSLEPANTSVPVIVTFKNYGTDPITALDLAYSYNGGPAVITPWTGLLNPGNSVSDTLPDVTILSGTFDLCAYTILVGDSNTLNDQLCKSIQGVPTDTLSYVTDFEGSSTGWYQSSSPGSTWEWGTPAFGQTNSAHSPVKAWDINLTSGYGNSALSYLNSPMFLFTGAFGNKLTFWINYYVEASWDGTRLEYTTDGTTWNVLGTMGDPNGVNWYTNASLYSSGLPGWDGTSSGWKECKYTLVQLDGFSGPVQFRFVFTSDGSVTYDGVSVDDFSIIKPSPIDGGVVSFVSPSSPASAGDLVPVTINVRNFGTNTLDTIPVKYSLNGGPVVTDTLFTTLAPGALGSFTFPVNMTVPSGIFDICAYTDLAGDGLHPNDTLCISIYGEPPFLSYYEDDFEGTTTQCYVVPGSHWQWGVPTSSVINFAHSPTKCWKTNLAGNYLNNQADYLYTPTFHFTGTSNATLRFWHWVQTETDHDIGNVQYSINNGTTWITLGYQGDPNGLNWYDKFVNGKYCWSGTYPAWMYSQYHITDPSLYAAPSVRFRYQFLTDVSGNAFNGWAVDDIVVTVDVKPKDIGVVAFVTPVAPTYIGAPTQVQVTLKNFGTDTLYTSPVYYKVNNGTPVSATWNGTLYPGATTDYSFTTPYTTPGTTYTLKSYSVMVGDPHKFNDTTSITFTPTLAPLDAGVQGVTLPGLISYIGIQDTVRIVVKNYGATTLTTFPVGYKIDSNPMVVENYTGSLASGSTDIYTFATLYTCPPTTPYTICTYTNLSGDMVHANDSLCKSVQVNVGIDEAEGNGLYLHQNIPNPAQNSTTIGYSLPSDGAITFTVVNVLGQKLFTLNRKELSGKHQIDLNLENYAVGVYYYTLNFDGKTLVKKMVVDK